MNGKLNEKHIIALTIVGLVAAIYLFYTFIFVPQSAQIEQLSTQCQQEQQKVSLIEAFQKAHPDMDQFLKQLDQEKIMADTKLPDDTDMRGFLVQGETAAKEANLPLLSVKYEKVVNQKGYREIPVNMKITGDYFKTLNFIKNMEQSPRFNSIKKIVMKMDKSSMTTEVSSSIFIYGIPAGDNPANGQK